MDKARLILEDGTEFELTERLSTLGRTLENHLSFPEDSNVSRFHAEIEDRGNGEFWLFDLQSSNGTTLNGERLTSEKPLSEGDVLVLGGSSSLKFTFGTDQGREEEEEVKEEEEESEEKDPEENPAETAEDSESAGEPAGKKFTLLLVFAALALGLAVILVAAAVLFVFTSESSMSACEATAEVVSPENGDIVSDSTTVEAEVTDGECVGAAVFIIGGKEFARANSAPYKADLDPAKFPEMSDGRDRTISVVLIDDNGKEILRSPEIAISIETIETETPEPTAAPVETNGGTGDTGKPEAAKRVSLIETQTLATKVMPQFAGNFQYNVNNPRFLDEVAKMIPEYRSEGFFGRASKYRDVINYQYIREQNLDPSVGYILAMSRSKFQPSNRAEGAGLWSMNNQLVLDNAYNGICGAETIASETQKCAAIASSSYLKDLILNVFNGEVIYGVAAFGMDKQEAAIWNASLPSDPNSRKEFWNVIKDPRQREQVVRFFAAAIVAENPQKFGLNRDKPISNLYPAYAE